MRHLLAALASLLLGCATARPAAPPPPPSALAAQALQLTYAGKAAQALPLFQAAFDAGLRDAGTFYDAACAGALASDLPAALRWLTRAAEAGFHDGKHLDADPDLAALRQASGYPEVRAKVQENWERREAARAPALRDELLAMVERDQAARQELVRSGMKPPPELSARLAALDRQHAARMQELLAARGWPTRSDVGESASKAAWLLVQHADHDPAFQERALALLEQAVAAGEAQPAHAAYLTDRVLVAQKRPQRYGTQFHLVDGKNVAQPIEDAAHVDARRKGVGLGTMAEYEAQMARMLAPPQAR